MLLQYSLTPFHFLCFRLSIFDPLPPFCVLAKAVFFGAYFLLQI